VDRALLENLRDGDTTAFETLYGRYLRPVTNYLTAFTRSTDTGREIAQDVFVRLWERREGIDPDKNIVRYLFTMARNRALDLIEDEKHYASEGVEAQDQREDTLSFAADIEYIAHEAELIIDIAISLMPPQRRKIYELSRKEQMSNTQIAELMGISKNTVENHITTALNDLRRTYAEYNMHDVSNVGV
jgi:RNA polymerase sigma-70 factor (ECF subfamily)